MKSYTKSMEEAIIKVFHLKQVCLINLNIILLKYEVYGNSQFFIFDIEPIYVISTP